MFGHMIVHYRRRMGLTQEELADPRAATARSLASAFGLTATIPA